MIQAEESIISNDQNSGPPLSSVSLVVVASESCPARQVLEALGAAVNEQYRDSEIIIVANGVTSAVAVELKALCADAYDMLVVFTAEQLHDDIARLIGIDYAVSDHVLFATPTLDEANAVPLLVEGMASGVDVVIGQGTSSTKPSLGSRVLFPIFQALFRWSTGLVFEKEPSPFRVLSRAAALFIATRNHGEVLVRSRYLGPGFPVEVCEMKELAAKTRERASFRNDLARGARFITTGSTMLLRASAYLALAGGIASAIYALYVLAIFLLSNEVQRGWTTLSLQLAGMLFLFSVQFLLLSEHVAQLTSSSGRSSRRHLVIREVRSLRSRRRGRLNVIDDKGQFQLGAPSDLLHREGFASK